MTDSQLLSDLTVALASPAVDPALRERYDALRRLRSEILRLTREARALSESLSADASELRRPADCLRCGYHWWPYNPFTRPRTCPRCMSTGWDEPPTKRSRKPSDPPAPSWRKRKGTGANKFRVMARDKWTRGPRREKVEPATLTVTSPPREYVPLPSVAAVPPRISAMLPPPPSPSQSAPSLSLYERLRAEHQQMEQPERMVSHEQIVPTTEVQEVETVIDVPTNKVQEEESSDEQ